MALIQFFPIDISYETNQEGRAAIQLFGRTVDGKKICVIDPSFKPYFYVIPYNKEQLRNLSERILNIKIERDNERYYVDEIKIETKNIFTKPVDLLKVFVNHPKAVNEIKKEVKLIKDVKDVRENDINFTKRYLIDKDILMLNLMEVEGDVVERNLNVEISIIANELKQVSQETFNNPRILAFDIETYTPEGRYPIEDKDPVIMISFYSNDGFRRVFTYKEFKTNHDYIKFVDSEYDLIQKFLETLEEYNPDFLVGYFTDGFDFPYLKARARKNNIRLMFNNSRIKITRKGQSSATKIKGLPHLDLLKFIRHIMSGSLRLDSYSLNSVAFELLKERKLDMNPQFIGKAFDEAGLELEKYCEYNLKDSELTLKIAEKILPNLEEIARLINTTIFDVCRMPYSGLVETYLMKRAKEFDEIFPNKPGKDMEAIRRMNSYQGAFIFNPIPGLHKNIVVFDFQSLYPSIIVAHNIDPSTLTNKDEGYKTPEILLETGEKIRHRFSSNAEGLIPSVIRDIITRRVRVKEMLKSDKLNPVLQARSYALKTLANSTYGYYAYFGARWYCRECAESITSFGRFYIQSLIERAQKEGFNVIYGDTDALFIALQDKTKEEALVFLEQVNRELPSLMELDLEDFYPRGIFVSKRGERGGAKKKYALISEDGRIKVRGFETIRRDWSTIAREVQKEVINIILIEDDPEKAYKYVFNIIKDVREKKIDLNKMIIQTVLKKGIDSYDLEGPHVIIAKKMREQGIPVQMGSVISYVVTEGKGRVRDKAMLPDEASNYDADYYINNQIIPAVETIFDAIGYSASELLTGKKQTDLGSFF